MAWEHLITADAFDNRIFTSTEENVLRSTSFARTGARSFQIYGGSIMSASANLNVPSANEKYVAFSVATNNSVHPGRFRIREATTIHLQFEFYAQGNSVNVYRGDGTTLLASVPGFTPNTVYYYDIYVKISDVDGRVIVKDPNGSILIDFTGNTRNGGTNGVVNNLSWWSRSNLSGTCVMYVDDIAVRSDDFCGPGGNYVRTPVGAGADADWTASAGQPFECVDEIPPTMADYILANSGSAGARATFQGSSPEGLAVIDTVGVYALAQLEFAGAGRILPVTKSGASYAQGEAQGVGTSETWIKSFFDADPGTAAPWSKNAVLASQFGVEVA